MRVGLHSAVVWKRLYFKPLSARRSSVGIRTGPPKALLAPKPMSSISTITTLGAPCGAVTANRGGAVASRASSVVIAAGLGSAIGSTVRSIEYGACCAPAEVTSAVMVRPMAMRLELIFMEPPIRWWTGQAF